MGNLNYNTSQVQQRLAQGYYDDIKAAGYTGTKAQLDALLSKAGVIMKAATTAAAGADGLVPAPAAGGQTKYLRGDGTWQTPPNTTYSPATASANGLMSKEDKIKLDGVDESIANVEAIARGKSRAKVFDTVAALDTWLAVAANKATLQIGDNFYIKVVDVPDYWWDGAAKQPIEGEKVDLTDYVRKEAGKGLFSGSYYDLNNKPYIPTIPGLATPNANGLMSMFDNAYISFLQKAINTSTLALLPTNARFFKVTLSAATLISFANTNLVTGQEVYIDCNPTASFTQPIPNTGEWRSMSGTSIAVTSGKPFEISIMCVSAGTERKYSIVVKEQD